MVSLASFRSLLLRALWRVLVVLILVAGGPESRHTCAWQWYLFFSFLAFLLEILLVGEGFRGFDTKGGRGFLTKLLWKSWVEEVCNLAIVEWAGRLLCEQYWFISRRINGSCRLAFASVLIAFLRSSSQLLCSRPCYSIWAFIDSLRLLQKNQIRLDSSGAPFLSNFWRINWRCSRGEVQFWTFFYWNWELCLTLL